MNTNRAQRRQKGRKITVAKDWLKEAQDALKKGIHNCTSAMECDQDVLEDSKAAEQVENLTKSLLNIAEYIKLTRELNEDE